LALLERSAALYRQLGDRLRLAPPLGMLGIAYVHTGRNAEAKALIDEAHKTLSASNHKKQLCGLINRLGILSAYMNDNIEAPNHYIGAIALARELKRSKIEYTCLLNLAESEYALGSAEQAIKLTQEAISGFRRLGRRDILGAALANLTQYFILQGNPCEARPVAREAFTLARENGGDLLRNCLEPWALLSTFEGRHRQAALLFGFTTARFAASGEIRGPTEQQIQDRLVQLLMAELSAADIQALATEGAQWNEEHAADFAFHELISPSDQGIQRPGVAAAET